MSKSTQEQRREVERSSLIPIFITPTQVKVPFACTTSFQSSFSVSACQLWNSLPNQVITFSSSSPSALLFFS